MTAEREIDYEALAQSAMRGIVRTVLARVAKSGLPGEHHFYIAFKTGAPGVILSKRLKERYPEEMTVVLQHRFWDLLVNDVRFEVKLTFDSIPERLVVPFSAIKVFFDPSVPYGLQFDEAEAEGVGAHQLTTAHGGEAPHADAGAGEPLKAPTGTSSGSEGSRAEKKPRISRRPQSEKGAERPAAADKAPAKHPSAKPSEPGPAAGPKVVSIDAFRKK
jgi:uncharacterized protein